MKSEALPALCLIGAGRVTLIRWSAGNQLHSLIVTLITAIALVSSSAEGAEPIQGGYSTKPLEVAVFDPAKVAVEAAAFNNWLNQNYASLTPESMKGPREHLYYLINSHVSSIYVREKAILPPEHDLVLEIFFSWAERLGVFGGHLVYNAIKQDTREPMPTLMPVPAPFSLLLKKDMLHVESKRGGWSAAVPYYFMIWNMAEFDATNGPRTQLLALSTSAAAHEGIEGHSQATLMLLSGPGQERADFESFYRAALGFSGDEPSTDLPVADLKSVIKFDESTSLHSELTSWQGKDGPIVVSYTGMNGTYQWNRPHFLDFLRSVYQDSQ